MNRNFKLSALTVALLIGVNIAILPSVSSAATKVDLGSAQSFGVLGASTVTNTGSSVISGSAGGLVGVTPGSAITGFPPGTATGGIVTGSTAPDPAALISAQAAYTSGRNQVPTTAVGAGLGGLILGEGAYAVPGSATLVGN